VKSDRAWSCRKYASDWAYQFQSLRKHIYVQHYVLPHFARRRSLTMPIQILSSWARDRIFGNHNSIPFKTIVASRVTACNGRLSENRNPWVSSAMCNHEYECKLGGGTWLLYWKIPIFVSLVLEKGMGWGIVWIVWIIICVNCVIGFMWILWIVWLARKIPQYLPETTLKFMWFVWIVWLVWMLCVNCVKPNSTFPQNCLLTQNQCSSCTQQARKLTRFVDSVISRKKGYNPLVTIFCKSRFSCHFHTRWGDMRV
jgi:hypothetical protein